MRNSPKVKYAITDQVGTAMVNQLVTLIPEGVKGDYLRQHILSKYVDDRRKSNARVRRSLAIEKWLKMEDRNRKTNMRLYLGDADFGFSTSDRLISLARRYIKQILGEFNPSKLWQNLVVTGGASTSSQRSPLTPMWKLFDWQHVTADALKWWLPIVSNSILGNRGGNRNFIVVRGNELFTVPKNSEIDRVACKEPDVNLFLQRAAGLMIRSRLKKFGIDLQDQSANQKLAREGSISRKLATIDLSSASDSITLQLVLLLLPSDWADFLTDVRSPATLIEGSWHENDMISSMGNGATFELESLIFFALTRAICAESRVKGKISVYGDDIVAPTRIVPRLLRIFNWFGFIPNQKKTFYTGDLRESCGRHYFRGYDVTPIYVRKPITSLADAMLLLNGVAQWSSRGWGFITDPEITEWWSKWSAIIPRRFRGGRDFSSRAQLVSDEKPLCRLLEYHKVIRSPLAETAYKLWHVRRLTGIDAETSLLSDIAVQFREDEHVDIGNDRLLHRLNISGK